LLWLQDCYEVNGWSVKEISGLARGFSWEPFIEFFLRKILCVGWLCKSFGVLELAILAINAKYCFYA
jgi:hypothetical protein